MTPLPRPSVSPLHSFASRPYTARFQPSLVTMLRQIMRWLRGRHALSFREQMLEREIVERLAEEIEDREVMKEPTKAKRHKEGGAR